MEVCDNCGVEISQGQKFCISCGTKIVQESIKISVPVESVEKSSSYSEKISDEVTTDTVAGGDGKVLSKNGSNHSVQIRIDSENISGQANAYAHFFKDTLMNPSHATDYSGENYGIIHYLILALLASLGGAAQILDLTGYMIFSSFFNAFFTMILMELAIYVCGVGATYVISRFVMKNENSFKNVLAYLGGYLSPVLIIYAISFVLSVLNSTAFIGPILLFNVFGRLMIFLGMVAYIYNNDNRGKLDKLYAIILATIAFIITYLILYRLLFQPIFTDQAADFGNNFMYYLMDGFNL